MRSERTPATMENTFMPLYLQMIAGIATVRAGGTGSRGWPGARNTPYSLEASLWDLLLLLHPVRFYPTNAQKQEELQILLDS